VTLLGGRMRVRSRWIGATLLSAVCAAGCASSGTGTTDEPAGAQSGIAINIQNNDPGGSTITVSVVPEVGVRRTLGQVPSGETRTFAYDGIPGQYQLIALSDVGGERRSEQFRIFANSLVRWNLSTNNVTVSGR
jgi:hypothetical protein